jgi:hypothetical protein
MIKFSELSDYSGLPLFNWAIDQHLKISIALESDLCYCTTAALKHGIVCWKCQRDFEQDMKEAK